MSFFCVPIIVDVGLETRGTKRREKGVILTICQMEEIYNNEKAGLELSTETKKLFLKRVKEKILPKMKFVANEHLFGKKGSIVKELKGKFGQFWRMDVTDSGMASEIFGLEKRIGGVELTMKNKCRLWMSIREDVLTLIRKHRSEVACEMKKSVVPGKKNV